MKAAAASRDEKKSNISKAPSSLRRPFECSKEQKVKKRERIKKETQDRLVGRH
jgi:hypothetical protein